MYATDVSLQQLIHARGNERVHYHVAAAEASALAQDSMDLVVVAQALHWFDIDAFVGELRRVLKRDGVFAAWCYQGMQISPDVDELVSAFYHDTVGPYWPAERRHVEAGYCTLELPLVEQAVPSFCIEREWDLTQVVNYVRSWSATQRYLQAHQIDPVVELARDLGEAWESVLETRRVRWPLAVRAGRLA